MAQLSELPHLIEAQDWAAAERVLRKASKAKAAPAEVFYNLAKVLEHLGKLGQRTMWLKRAVAKRPGYAVAWFELGRAFLDAGDVEAARDAFHRAYDADPGDADARRMVARLSIRLGLWDAARRALQDDQDAEARLARYRIRAETGVASKADRDALLQDAALRPEALRTLTRVARGSLPLRLPQLRT